MPELNGPHGRLTYTRDAWGYPTIQAPTADAGVWARGWFAGYDRPLQVTFTIRAAQGRLMETLGDLPFTRLVDRAIRSLGMTHDLDAQVASMTDERRAWLQNYCDGFNAGVEAGGWPVVLKALGVQRLHYTPALVVLYQRMAGWFGLTSLHHTASLLTGQLIAEGVAPDVLELLTGQGHDAEALRELLWPTGAGVPGLTLQQGSNAFAVSGKRTPSGAGLLMTEFHMEIARIPPVCWAFSVQLPDDEQTGICIPGLPFVSAGRNRRVAWGWTFGHADNFQVTAERCVDGRRVVGDGTEALRPRHEVVHIRGGTQELWTFWDFDGGTVLGNARAGGLLPAMRWRGLRDTAHDVEVFARGLQATSAQDAADIHRSVRGISLAGTFADADGQIAYVHTGRVAAGCDTHGPLGGRESCDGPDRVEAERPYSVDPTEGFIASANEACPGWTAYSEPRYRHERLRELLSGDGLVRGDDLLRFSYDELDGCARRLLPIWAPYLPDELDAREMVVWAGGGASQDADGRRAMGLFHALHRELLRALVAAHTGPAAAAVFWDELDLLLAFQDRLDDVLALQVPEHCTVEQLAAMIVAAWPEAKRKAAAGEVSGPVRASFKNMATQGWLRWLGFSTPVMDLPGGPTSLFQSRRSELLGETLYGGPAFHLLIDLSVPGLRYNIAGGASEKRLGAGYAAGLEAWRTGELKGLGRAD